MYFHISFQDINECENNSYHFDNGNCSNTIGSWDVTCQTGFISSKYVDNYNRSCVGRSKSSVIFISTKNILILTSVLVYDVNTNYVNSFVQLYVREFVSIFIDYRFCLVYILGDTFTCTWFFIFQLLIIIFSDTVSDSIFKIHMKIQLSSESTSTKLLCFKYLWIVAPV